MAGKTATSVRIVSNRLPEIAASLRPKIGAVVRTAGLDIQAGAQQRAPVLTGTLRRSITAQFPTDLQARIGPSVAYGVYVEMGTRHMPARPYLRPAAESVLPQFAGRVKAALGGL